jgi:hypothetical protein
MLVAGVVVLNAAGWLVDASPLRQEEGSWGFAFAAALCWPLVTCVRR